MTKTHTTEATAKPTVPQPMWPYWRNFATLANFQNLWLSFEGLFIVKKKFEPTFCKISIFAQFFIDVNVEKYSCHQTHVVTLATTNNID